MFAVLVCAVLLTAPAEDHQEALKDFKVTVDEIIKTVNQVASTRQEQDDLRALQFYQTKLSRAIAEGDWDRAWEIPKRMMIPLQRSYVVAVDAPRRIRAQQRADEERRHREEMEQRERMHREEMQRQQEIIRRLNYLLNNRVE